MGAALTTPAVPQWQLREGGSAQALPTWGVNLAAYDWNFGTLGGGDLKLAAGRDALNVTGAAAGSLLPQYGGGTQTRPAEVCPSMPGATSAAHKCSSPMVRARSPPAAP